VKRAPLRCVLACLVALTATSCVRTLMIRPGSDCMLTDEQVARTVSISESVAANHGLHPGVRGRHSEALGTGSSATTLLVSYEGRHADGFASLIVRLRQSPRRIAVEVRDPSRSGDTDFTRQLRRDLRAGLEEALPGCGFSAWPRPGQ
jgi:hypothetical protein